MKIPPKFYECGICGMYHPASWNGDCRDDANRFDLGDLETLYGDDWQEVDMETLPGYAESFQS